MHRKVLLSILTLVCICLGCAKTAPTSTASPGVPNITFTKVFSITLPAYTNLVAVGGTQTITGGYAGIMVYHQTTNGFLAYDAGCPYDCILNSKAVLTIQTTTATCPVCGSEFSLATGALLTGPSTLPLKQYQTAFTSNTLTISN